MNKIAVIGIVGNSVFLEVEKFHEGGETVEAKSTHFELGGKGFNQAVAAARYGAEVSFLAAVGADSIENVRSFLENEGIKATLSKKEEQTAFAAIITDKNGSNRVTVYQGAQLSLSDVADFENEIQNADILLLTNEVDEEINLKAIKIAKKYGVKVILNPAPARVSDSFILDNTDLFTPNEHEMLGIEDKTNVIMTAGKRGCIIKEEKLTIPAVNVAKAVDTTGAGDTFNGVLAAMLSNGASLSDAAKRANLASSIGVTRKYAVSSIPTKNEIEDFLKCKKD